MLGKINAFLQVIDLGLRTDFHTQEVFINHYQVGGAFFQILDML
jgi:hypothetical protein